MRHRLATIFVLSGVVLLSGCAYKSKRIPDYSCPLTGVGAGNCASMQDAYQASKKVAPGKTAKVQSVFDTRAQSSTGTGGTGRPGDTAMPVVGAQLSNLASPSNGTPVYIQPKAMRVWLAPYKDSGGNLRSGEYAFFATEGRWAYGSLNESGAGGHVSFQPSRPKAPDAPVIRAAEKAVTQRTTAVNAEQAVPPAPAEVNAAAQGVFNSASQSPQVNKGGSGAAVTLQPSASAGITQPYDRIGQ